MTRFNQACIFLWWGSLLKKKTKTFIHVTYAFCILAKDFTWEIMTKGKSPSIVTLCEITETQQITAKVLQQFITVQTCTSSLLHLLHAAFERSCDTHIQIISYLYGNFLFWIVLQLIAITFFSSLLFSFNKYMQFVFAGTNLN